MSEFRPNERMVCRRRDEAALAARIAGTLAAEAVVYAVTRAIEGGVRTARIIGDRVDDETWGARNYVKGFVAGLPNAVKRGAERLRRP